MNISIKNTAEFQTLNKYLNYGSNEIKKQRISLKTRINKMMSKNPQYKNVLYIINNNIDKNLHRYTADGGKNKDSYRWEFLKTMLQSRLQNML